MGVRPRTWVAFNRGAGEADMDLLLRSLSALLWPTHIWDDDLPWLIHWLSFRKGWLVCRTESSCLATCWMDALGLCGSESQWQRFRVTGSLGVV